MTIDLVKKYVDKAVNEVSNTKKENDQNQQKKEEKAKEKEAKKAEKESKKSEKKTEEAPKEGSAHEIKGQAWKKEDKEEKSSGFERVKGTTVNWEKDIFDTSDFVDADFRDLNMNTSSSYGDQYLSQYLLEDKMR